MKLQTKNLFSIKTFFAGLVIVFTAFVGFTQAHADSAVTITGTPHNTSHAVITTASIGSLIHDSVTVGTSTASTTPTGTVDFNLYPNTSCSGTSSLQSGISLVSGVAESATTTMPATGLSYKVHYNGDALNIASDGACQSVTATASGTGITTTLSSTTVQVGTSVYQTSSLTGATSNATGTVKYAVYTNNACTTGAQDGGSMSVVNATVPNSNAIQFNFAGTYYWQAVYSGDTNNSAATSSCASGLLTVLAVGSSTPSTGTGVIAGTLFNDLNKNHVKDSGEPGLSGRTINLYKGAGWFRGVFKNNKGLFLTTTTDANGYYSFSNLADGVYSVEEINAAGWRQTTSDFRSIKITNGSSKLDANFAEVEKAQQNQNPKPGHDDNFFHRCGQKINDFFKNKKENHEDKDEARKDNHGKEVSKIAKGKKGN